MDSWLACVSRASGARVVNVADAGNAIAHRSERSGARAGNRENASRSAAEIAGRSMKSPPITAPGSSRTSPSRSTQTGRSACNRLLTTASLTAPSVMSIPAANRRVTVRTDPRNGVCVPMLILSFKAAHRTVRALAMKRLWAAEVVATIRPSG
jgi:hypothetical protein